MRICKTEFNKNNPEIKNYNSIRRNVLCEKDGKIDVTEVKSDEIGNKNKSLWFLNKDGTCGITEEEENSKIYYFYPTILEIKLNKTNEGFNFKLTGEHLLPCNISFALKYSNSDKVYMEKKFDNYLNESLLEGSVLFNEMKFNLKKDNCSICLVFYSNPFKEEDKSFSDFVTLIQKIEEKNSNNRILKVILFSVGGFLIIIICIIILLIMIIRKKKKKEKEKFLMEKQKLKIEEEEKKLLNKSEKNILTGKAHLKINKFGTGFDGNSFEYSFENEEEEEEEEGKEGKEYNEENTFDNLNIKESKSLKEGINGVSGIYEFNFKDDSVNEIIFNNDGEPLNNNFNKISKNKLFKVHKNKNKNKSLLNPLNWKDLNLVPNIESEIQEPIFE